MAVHLTVSLSSFPYAAAALAFFTGRAQIVFDDVQECTLQLNQSRICGEEAIVQALADIGEVSSNNAKVMQRHD